MNIHTAPQPRRRWYQLRWWQFILLILLALVGWFYVQDQQGKAIWNATLAAWDAEGRWRWHQVVEDRPAVPDDENLAIIIGELAKQVRVYGATLYLEPDDKAFPPLRAQPQQLLPEAALVVLRRRQKDTLAFQKMLPRLYRNGLLSRMPFDVSQGRSMMTLNLVDDARQVQNRLHDLCLLDIESGNSTTVVQNLLAMDKMVHALIGEPGLIYLLCSRSFVFQQCETIQRLLAQVELDDLNLVKLQEALSQHDTNRHWRQALFTDASHTYDVLEKVKDKTISVVKLFNLDEPSKWWEYPWFWIQKLYLHQLAQSYHQKADAMQHLLDVYQQSNQPWSKQYAALLQIAEKLRQQRSQQVSLKHLISSGYEKHCIYEMKTIALIRSTIVGIAAERFRREHQRWPASNAELIGKFLPKEIDDPFDDKPLRMKTVPDGLIIYSIGTDKKDDGGMVLPKIEEPTADIGFKLWNVPQRRQDCPPLPPRGEG